MAKTKDASRVLGRLTDKSSGVWQDIATAHLEDADLRDSLSCLKEWGMPEGQELERRQVRSSFSPLQIQQPRKRR
jgi:hypothetical protein